MRKFIKQNRVFVLLGGAILCLCLTGQGEALELRTEGNIFLDAEETVGEDLIAIGHNIEIKGEVSGDLIAAGRRLYCEGIIDDDLMAVGLDIRVSAEIGDNLRAVGSKIITDAHVMGDMVLSGASVILRESCLAEGDVAVAGGEIEIDGKILKGLRAYGKTINIKGEIAKNAQLKGEKIIMFPGARIEGNLSYTCPNEIEMRGDAEVVGEITRKESMMKGKLLGLLPMEGYKGRVIVKSLFMLPLLLIGLILIGVSPRQVHITMDAMHGSPGRSLLFGFAFIICLPVGAAIACATIVGIPFGSIVLFSYFCALYVSKLFAGMAIAMKIFGMRGRSSRSVLLLGMLLGSAIVILLSTIPVGGVFITLLLIIFGLGGLVLGRLKTFALARENGLV